MMMSFDSYEDECSSVETDPKWGRELDSEGEPIYTYEHDLYPDRECSLLMLFSLTLIVRMKIGLTNLGHFRVCFCSCGCVLANDDFCVLGFFDALFSVAQ